MSNRNKKKQQKPSEQVNYTLSNPDKITFEFLKSYLWSAADILRGSLDPSDTDVSQITPEIAHSENVTLSFILPVPVNEAID